ncbi:hypothetical protein [Phosphitispora fastidiosa]|uniref:hypothetical protein n=1 Tax=Phosphitispora fastidiosa TaxID=2837202 RepID=UPI001E43A984|nr:hypothetical protein [Phosphitispora fastidiosa]MBU7006201.1 hypothetical protein [Phosphitispora fastidiosa]
MRKILVLCLGMLVLLAAGCGGNKNAFSPDSPEGVAQAYYQALQDGKPDAAYGYLKDWSMSKEEYVNEKKSNGMMFKSFAVQKGEVVGKAANVPVKFETGITSMPEINMMITMEKDENNWKITSLGMEGVDSHGAEGSASGMPPAGGMPPTGGMPPAGGMGGVNGAVYGSPNPHSPGGSIPLDQ